VSAANPVIRVEGLTKAYGRTPALRDVTLQILPGEVFGYLGPNGAGKTTTLRLLMGLIKPTAGRAEILGLDVWRQPVQVHRQVGYLSGEPALYDRMTGADHVRYFEALRAQAPRGTSAARAAELAGRLELDLTRPARALSKGNRQKLAVILALMSAPSLLIVDEPTAGLDPMAQQEFQALIREHTAAGGTVLLSSHVLTEVQRVADRIGVLRAGRLIAVERLDDLRGKSLHHVTAQFGVEVPAAEFTALPGVRDARVTGRRLTCSAPQSSLDALVKQVARYPVLDFECAEAELEETFMAYYGGGDDAA
jgi:ABC-2 type transport system ATP-binding protein